MKKQPFIKRLLFALAGVRSTLAEERSFRTQVFCAGGALLLLVAIRPKPIWWAIIATSVFAVLAAEMFNTALETLVDHLHPVRHPMIGRAKDCAAGGVLLLSLSAVLVALAMIFDTCFT